MFFLKLSQVFYSPSHKLMVIVIWIINETKFVGFSFIKNKITCLNSGRLTVAGMWYKKSAFFPPIFSWKHKLFLLVFDYKNPFIACITFPLVISTQHLDESKLEWASLMKWTGGKGERVLATGNGICIFELRFFSWIYCWPLCGQVNTVEFNAYFH